MRLLSASLLLVALAIPFACTSSPQFGSGGGGASSSATGTGGAGGSGVGGAGGATTTSSSSSSGGPCGKANEACCADYKCDAGLVCDGAHCNAAIAPYSCAPGSPETVFVSEVAPVATLSAWERPFASVTFANCGSGTWAKADTGATTGVKLGPSTPHDTDFWTPPRIALPGDVAPGNQVTIVVPIHAKPLTGTHPYSYELLNEGVAWLGQASPLHAVEIDATASPMIALCPGNMADPSGVTDASKALQACIDAVPAGGTLALPPGIFRVSTVVTIQKPMTLTTTGAMGAAVSCLDYNAPKCAVLRAAADTQPSQQGTRGFLRLGPLATQASNIVLDHILVDGNREARLGSPAATQCAMGNNGDGISIGANCKDCKVLGVASARALCGSGLEWDGDGITVKNSSFFANGDHNTQNMWSDGLTIHKSDGAVVEGCSFIDNSDVGFISGGGLNAVYQQNYAGQFNQSSFAALMLDNFNSPALGDFTGAVLQNNTVVCATPCHFGIEVGPHPWYPSPNIIGGAVTGNTVMGAYIEINAQGAGTAQSPTVIANNIVGPVPAGAPFNCGTVNGLTPFNVSPESYVDLMGGVATGSISVPCP
jgi:hypothetical protein